MKFVYIAFIFALIASAFAYPTPEIEEEQEHLRVKRATCDIVGSIEFKGFRLNDAPCAAHCLALGKSGGWCDGRKVCHCR